ncbi:MAG: polysaccharide biosynthesis tyrosine autokinase [Marinilabiliaceae bacterium]|nr:polysaccharide biosynthesis tyrosine autokinase [Marinilabiliaceae bacterium]
MANEQEEIYEEEEGSLLKLDFRKLFSDIIRFWWIYVVCLLIAMVLVFVYHRYKTPVYSAEMTLLINDDRTYSNTLVSQNSMMEGFAIDGASRSMANQVAILQSRTMRQRVIDKMGLDITYYNHGRVIDRELYPNKIFRVIMDPTHVQPMDVMIDMEYVDSLSFRLLVDAENVALFDYSNRVDSGRVDRISHKGRYRFGEPIVTDWCAFTIIQNPENISLGEYSFRFNYPYSADFGFSVSTDDESSVVSMRAVGTSSKKNCNFLNTIAATFIADNLRQKNLIAENTIAFIESQLVLLSDTLMDIGTQLSSFRIKHDLQQSVESKSNQLFKDVQSVEADIQKQRILLSYYEYLEKYMSNDSVLNDVIAPAMYETGSPIITSQLRNIMELNAEKEAYQSTYGTGQNPLNREVLAKLRIARNTLLMSVANHKQMVLDNINGMQMKVDSIKSEVRSLPETERKFIGIDRRFALNNEVYNFLLRKRSEAQIQKASNTADHKVLDSAETMGIVSPNRSKNNSIALFMALILPTLVLVVRQLVDNKLRTVEDLKKMTSRPIVAEIPSSNYNTVKVVCDKPSSIVAETYRRMRTRLDFLTAGKEKVVIGVTSSMPGDGKTFTALNVASVYAISGKRVALLGFDLRRPGMSKALNMEKHIGITDYIVGQCTLEDMRVEVAPNLDAYPAGTIPPNPSELISNAKSIDMIEDMRAKYDVLVIDTPPVGMVSDAFQILPWCDTMLFIARQDYTYKDILKNTLESFDEQNIKNVAVVLNDINSKNSRYGYGYGYGYGSYHYGRYSKKRYGMYGKSYGYYSED